MGGCRRGRCRHHQYQELHARTLVGGTVLPDTVHWVKFSGVAWTNAGNGFFSRFPAPPAGEALSAASTNQKIPLVLQELGIANSVRVEER